MPKKLDMVLRRTELAEAAIAAIAERGLEVRLVDVAAAAGCTTGSLQHFFGQGAGKDAVLRLALEEVMARLLAAERFEQLSDPVAALSEALPLDEARRREWRVWLAFWGRAAFEPTLGALHRDYYRRIGEHLRPHLAHLPDPELAADAIISAIDGVGTRATLEPELWPAERQQALLRAQLEPLLKERTHA
jgi:TetR/AcrR family transcriptional repressor of bet genes